MKKFLTLAFAAVSSCICTAGTDCTVSENIVSKVAVYTLDNGILQVKCIPEASGLISGFYSIAEKREMIPPVNYRVIEDDLLPRRFSVKKHSGIKETAAGINMEYFTGYQVQKKESGAAESVLELYSRSYYSRDISVNKKIRLKKGESLAKISLEFNVHSKIDKNFVFWINNIGTMGRERDVVLVPADGNDKERNGKGLTEIGSRKGIYVDALLNPQNFYIAPIAPWMARYSAKRAGVLAMAVRKGTDKALQGYFSTWKHAQSPMHTAEMLFCIQKFDKGDFWNVEYDILYFAGLRSLRAIAGNYGIDRDGDTLLIASAAPAAPGTLKLKWADGAAEVKLPGLTPGEVFKIDLKKAAAGAGTAKLTGIMPGDAAFELPELLLQ